MTPRWVARGGALVALVLVAHGVHALVAGPGSSEVLTTVAYIFVFAGSAAGCLARAWVVPENRRQWTLIGSGLVAWTYGELWLGTTASAPGVADALFITAYVLALAGVVGLYRKDLPARAASLWLDAVTGVLTVTAIWAALAAGPNLAAALDLSWSSALNVVYPLFDLLLLLVVLVGLASRGWRADRTICLLGSGLLMLAFTDMLYAWQVSAGTYVSGTVQDTAWLAGALLVATAAWQPVSQPTEPPLGARETILPAVFAGLALAVLVLCNVFEMDVDITSLLLATAAIVSAIARSAITSTGYLRMLAVSERGRADLRMQTAKTRAGEVKLNHAHRLAHFGQWEWDPATDLMTASSELYRLLELGDPRVPVHWSPDLTSRLHDNDRERVQNALRRAVKTGEHFSFETRVLAKDGSTLTFQVDGAVDRTGQDPHVYGSAQDITQRHGMERSLREAEALFRTAFDDAPVGMSLVAPDGSWLRVNSAYRHMLGYTDAGLADKTLHDLTHPDEVAANKAFMSHAVAGGPESTTVEQRRIHRDGRVLHVRVRFTLVRDESDEPMYFICLLENNTERDRGRAALERLGTLVEASQDAIFSTDPSGYVNSWNPASELLFEHSAADAVGQPLEALLGEDPLSGTDEMVWLGADGAEHHLSVSASALRNHGGETVGCSYIVRDITARIAAAADQRRLEARLHHNEKLESLGTLAGGVAHDFNNLLAVILNYADFLIEDADSEQTRSDLGELRSAAERGADLTRQLLMVTRRGLSQPEVFNLDAHVLGIKRLLERTIGEDIELDVSLEAGDVNVQLDPSEFDQILMNLCVNSRHAMPSGGTLRIATEVLADQRVALDVCDTGGGMDEHVVAQAFDPFFTTKAVGTGLGLATVYGVATRAGGDAEIESSSAAGTKVRVLLPVAVTTGVPVDEERVPAIKRPEHLGASILVVEDDAPVREAARRILTGAGYAVACAENGEVALAIVQQDRPELVLTDVVMPGMTGTRLAERVREAAPGVKVLFMTGYSGDFTLRNGLAEGDLNVVHKPFDAPTLKTAVRAALHR